MSNIKQTAFLKAWVRNNSIVYPLSLGVLHPLISHGFLGDHGVQLTTPEFILHTLAIMLFAVLLAIVQNRSLRLLNFPVKQWDGIPLMIILIPTAFWTGYYTLYIPFDILFMMLTIGVINAFRLRSFMNKPKKWMWQSIVTSFLGALAGIAVGFTAFFLGVMNLPGVLHDMGLWLAISIPAGVVTALVSKRFLKDQIAKEIRLKENESALYQFDKAGFIKTAKAV
jgi:hypothetical protein